MYEFGTINLNEEQNELITYLSEKCDKINAELSSSIRFLIDEVSTNNSINEFTVYDIKDKLSKAWKAIVEFFKKCVRYIKEKLQGKVHDLNIKYTIAEKNEDHKIEFYTKMKKFKTVEFSKNDKIVMVDVEKCYGILKNILTEIGVTKFDESTGEVNVEDNLNTSGTLDPEDLKIVNSDLYDSEGIGGLYAMAREAIYSKPISGNDKELENYLKTFINGVNKYYEKAITIIYKVSRKVIKRAKKEPGRRSYKLYLMAKSISATCLNASRLIIVQE